MRLRIGTLDYDPHSLQRILCPECFSIHPAELSSLSSLEPDAVVLGFDDWASGMALAEQILLRHPRVVILMVGPSQSIQHILAAMSLGVRQVIPEGAAGELRTALDWAWTLQQGLLTC